MKAFYTLIIFCLAIITSHGQGKHADPQDNKEPEEKIDIVKEYDEDGNIIKYDSSYSWSWSGDGMMDDEMLQRFEEKMERLQEEMEVFSDEFISDFHWYDDLLEGFEEFHKDFKMQFNDSLFSREHFEQFLENHDFEFHGFNFDNNNIEVMPFDKEKIKEMEKRMQDLFNGEFDERIRKFIEEHKKEIDEIKYQIRESIPKHRKAI